MRHQCSSTKRSVALMSAVRPKFSRASIACTSSSLYAAGRAGEMRWYRSFMSALQCQSTISWELDVSRSVITGAHCLSPQSCDPSGSDVSQL